MKFTLSVNFLFYYFIAVVTDLRKCCLWQKTCFLTLWALFIWHKVRCGFTINYNLYSEILVLLIMATACPVACRDWACWVPVKIEVHLWSPYYMYYTSQVLGLVAHLFTDNSAFTHKWLSTLYYRSWAISHKVSFTAISGVHSVSERSRKQFPENVFLYWTIGMYSAQRKWHFKHGIVLQVIILYLWFI